MKGQRSEFEDFKSDVESHCELQIGASAPSIFFFPYPAVLAASKAENDGSFWFRQRLLPARVTLPERFENRRDVCDGQDDNPFPSSSRNIRLLIFARVQQDLVEAGKNEDGGDDYAANQAPGAALPQLLSLGKTESSGKGGAF